MDDNAFEHFAEMMRPLMNDLWKALVLSSAKTDKDKKILWHWFDVFEKHGIDVYTTCEIIAALDVKQEDNA